MAEFCVAFKMTPAEYKQLTRLEYLAFIDTLSGKQNGELIP
jgi:hypothetical protein